MNCAHRALAASALCAAIICINLPPAEAAPITGCTEGLAGAFACTDVGAWSSLVAAYGITGIGMVDFNMTPFNQGPGVYFGSFPGGASISRGAAVTTLSGSTEQVLRTLGDETIQFSQPVQAVGFDLVGTEGTTPPGAGVEVAAYDQNGPVTDTTIAPSSFWGVVSPINLINTVWPIETVLGEVILIDNIMYPGGPGSSPANPITPTGTCGQAGCFVFAGMPIGGWYDPALANGYTFTSQGGTFTSINDFPTGFSQPFIVSVGGVELGSFGPGQSVDFPDGGVTQFTISGIDPAVDGTNPMSFPIDLTLSTLGASFTMQALTSSSTSVPEPSTLALTLTGLGMAGAFARYRRRPSRAVSLTASV